MERLDPDQQMAVTSPHNTVVTAGAGSGKTTVLAARFLHLLKSRDVAIDAVLALTFTNKAAAEMYTRIYRELLSSPDKKLQAALLDFHQAHIATLDSFSSRIVRADAVRFGLAEDFAIQDEELDQLADRTALEFYLDFADRPSLKALVRRHGLTRVRPEVR